MSVSRKIEYKTQATQRELDVISTKIKLQVDQLKLVTENKKFNDSVLLEAAGLLYKADILNGDDQPDKAIELMQQIETELKVTVAATGLTILAISYYQKNDMEKSLSFSRRALICARSSSFIHLLIYLASMRNGGNYADCIQYLIETGDSQYNPDSVGRYALALSEDINRLAAQDKKKLEIYRIKGNQFLLEGKPKDAYHEFEKALRISPVDPYWHAAIANCLELYESVDLNFMENTEAVARELYSLMDEKLLKQGVGESEIKNQPDLVQLSIELKGYVEEKKSLQQLVDESKPEFYIGLGYAAQSNLIQCYFSLRKLEEKNLMILINKISISKNKRNKIREKMTKARLCSQVNNFKLACLLYDQVLNINPLEDVYYDRAVVKYNVYLHTREFDHKVTAMRDCDLVIKLNQYKLQKSSLETLKKASGLLEELKDNKRGLGHSSILLQSPPTIILSRIAKKNVVTQSEEVKKHKIKKESLPEKKEIVASECKNENIPVIVETRQQIKERHKNLNALLNDARKNLSINNYDLCMMKYIEAVKVACFIPTFNIEALKSEVTKVEKKIKQMIEETEKVKREKIKKEQEVAEQLRLKNEKKEQEERVLIHKIKKAQRKVKQKQEKEIECKPTKTDIVIPEFEAPFAKDELSIADILDKLMLSQHKAYIVGGISRKVVDKEKIQQGDDIDIVTTATVEELEKIFGNKLIKTKNKNLVRVQLGCGLSAEVYCSPALVNGRAADASLRDFYCNTAYLERDSVKKLYNLYDPTQKAIAHIKEKKLDTVGNPKQSLMQHPIRILRLFFYKDKLKYTMDDRVVSALKEIFHDKTMNYNPFNSSDAAFLGALENWLGKIFLQSNVKKQVNSLIFYQIFSNIFGQEFSASLDKHKEYFIRQVNKIKMYPEKWKTKPITYIFAVLVVTHIQDKYARELMDNCDADKWKVVIDKVIAESPLFSSVRQMNYRFHSMVHDILKVNVKDIKRVSLLAPQTLFSGTISSFAAESKQVVVMPAKAGI